MHIRHVLLAMSIFLLATGCNIREGGTSTVLAPLGADNVQPQNPECNDPTRPDAANASNDVDPNVIRGVSMAGWKTYSDDEFNYAVSYPKGWEIGPFLTDPTAPEFSVYSPRVSGIPGAGSRMAIFDVVLYYSKSRCEFLMGVAVFDADDGEGAGFETLPVSDDYLKTSHEFKIAMAILSTARLIR